MRFSTVELFDPTRYLFDERYCWAMLEGKLLYRDKDYLSNDGDLFVGRKFAAERAALGRESRTR